MAKARNTNLPQHDQDQGHYGELTLNMMPSPTGLPSGTIYVWDGDSVQYGVQTGTGGGDTVKVSSNDTTSNYLLSKLVAGDNITLTENNDGGNETITISGEGGAGGGGVTAGVWSIRKSGSNQTLTQNVDNTITFDYTVIDSGEGVIDLGNDRFVIPNNGIFAIIPEWHWTTTAPDSAARTYVFVNGTVTGPLHRVHASTLPNTGSLTGTTILELQEGDLVTMGAHPGNVASVNARGTESDSTSTTFSLARITSVGVLNADFIGCKIYNSGSQSINTATTTPITFNLEEFDTSGFHDTSSNTSRITIPAGLGGKYLVGGMTSWDTNTTGERYIRIRKNGGTDVRGSHIHASADAGGPKFETQVLVDLQAGDYVEVCVFQDSGGNRNIGAGAGSDLHMSTAWAYRILTNDHKVQVTSNDTTPDYLIPKISGSHHIDVYEYNNGGNEILVLSGTPWVPSLALGDRIPASPGTYDEEFNGTADTLPTDWAWGSAPTGSDAWYLNSRWPSLLTTEGTANTDYTLTRTSFSAASTFGIWTKVHVGPFIAADAAAIRMYVSNSAVNEARGINFRATGSRTSGVRALKIVGGSESVWGTELTGLQTGTSTLYMGLTRDGSNNFTAWYSFDGIAWDRLATAESHTITIDRIRFAIRTSSATSIVGIDWVRYRTDNAFPRP